MNRERAETYLRELAEAELRARKLPPRPGLRAGRLALAEPALVAAGAVGLCTKMGNPGHGITAPPAADLPQPWRHMLTRPRRLPQAEPAPGIAAAAIAELPELDGARITILGLQHGTIPGLHHSDVQTIVHAGQRRYAARRLDLRPGRPATAGAVGSRQQRPLARHPHPWRVPVTEQPRGHRVACDRAPAGQRHPLDRCDRHRPISRGPDQAAALLEAKPLKRSRPPPARISWTASPPKLPQSSATLPATPAKSRSYQMLKP